MCAGTARIGSMRVVPKLPGSVFYEDRPGMSTGPPVFGVQTQKLPSTGSCVCVWLRLRSAAFGVSKHRILRLHVSAFAAGCVCVWLRLRLAAFGWTCVWLRLRLAGPAFGCVWLDLRLAAFAFGCVCVWLDLRLAAFG